MRPGTFRKNQRGRTGQQTDDGASYMKKKGVNISSYCTRFIAESTVLDQGALIFSSIATAFRFFGFSSSDFR